LGYEILKAYLDAWKQSNPKQIKLWEEQTAEHLLQRLTGGNSVTTLDHVKGISKVLPEISFSGKIRERGSEMGSHFLKMAFGLW
jgi:hypothetical protein